ncbi:DNA sulfur modification protein DndB [Tenacibaculum aestuarii]|uniref:DNA sulfur modification protein DndB n=1 Tax=Tenacibaculum aestuarii TaxID=362781 RepID=UPI00389503CB
MIHLACTLGNLGYWDYYSTLMKVKDIVSNQRIITVAESEELYTNNINKVLQREISENRIKALSEYILGTDERFFSSLVVAIHKGSPKWTEIDISNTFDIEGKTLDEKSIDFLSSKFGVLSLSGNEQIFALDGQHRLKGLRKAFKDDNTIGELEIPVTFVIHNQKRLEKTRRLFTVLNKYAEKPKGAELIILDEDDAAAIITRRLVTEHPILSLDNAISSSKTGAIPKNDYKSFTTLVTINKINKILFKKTKSFYTKRPSDNELDELYKVSSGFWNSVFKTFPNIEKYINGGNDVKIDNKLISRKSSSGGSLLLRPIGQELISIAYSKFDDSEIANFEKKLVKIDFNLSNDYWKYVFWNDKMLGKELRLKKGIILKLMGKPIKGYNIDNEMKRIYKLYNKIYNFSIKEV